MRNIIINNKLEGLKKVAELNEKNEGTHTYEYNGTNFVTESLYILVGDKTIYSLSKTTTKYVDGRNKESVIVRKMTNNPFGVLGKEFDTFNEAMSAYKTPEIKLGLLKLEMGLS